MTGLLERVRAAIAAPAPPGPVAPARRDVLATVAGHRPPRGIDTTRLEPLALPGAVPPGGFDDVGAGDDCGTCLAGLPCDCDAAQAGRQWKPGQPGRTR
jgi:hypothetical protein